MPPTSDPATPSDHRGHLAGPAPVAQWVGLLLAPAVFFVHLQVGYLLVLWACDARGPTAEGMRAIHAAGALAVALALTADAALVLAERALAPWARARRLA